LKIIIKGKKGEIVRELVSVITIWVLFGCEREKNWKFERLK
jgi:hypothetical protein